MDLRVPRRADYFASQVAYELVRCNAKQPGRVKREGFLAPVPHSDKKSERARARSQALDKNRLELSKQVWLARVSNPGPRPPGAKGKGKPDPKPEPKTEPVNRRKRRK